MSRGGMSQDRFSEGLLAYYPFLEGSGADLNNVLRGGNGNLVNTPPWQAGVGGFSLNFTRASSQRVNFGASSTKVSNNTAFTINFWLNSSDTGVNAYIIYSEANSASLNPRFFFDYNDSAAGDIGWGILDDTGTDISIFTAGISSNNGQWNMITAVRRSKSDHELYMNGVSRGTSSGTVTTFTPNNAQIGVMNNNSAFNNYLTGNVCNFRIYNYALPAKTILALYNART